jgi:predicted Zn finger-like uncharacterized protein
MKFTCDSCNAQYMISDEKVGPAGVKVRCKKCGHVILVRRVAEAAAPAGDTAPAVAAPAGGPSPPASGATAPGIDAPPGGASSGAAPSGEAPSAAGGGLDAELGSAFDHAFGDTPPASPAPAADVDLGATQAMGAEDAAKVFSAPTAAATEWYVAIGQAQVGPLPLGEVRKKWEAGDVGPDSLVWRPGMGDWAPLTTVAELAGFLAPVPRATARPAARPAVEAPQPEPQPAPAAEVAWKPAGASALAALASEELAARSPDARPAPVRPAGVKSLVDALPDGGGVDPTGALPLNIKALEATTGEKKIERRSSVARGAEKVRHRRSATRALVVGLVVGILLVAGAGVAAVGLGWVNVQSLFGGTAPKTAAAPLPPPPALPAAATPQPAPQPPPPPATPPAQPAVAAAPPAAAAQAPAVQEPKPAVQEPKPERRASAPRPARTEPPPAREPVKREPQRVAAAASTATAKKGGSSILDFDSGGSDSALDDALGGGSAPSGKRSVYVPPAPAGGGALPDKVSPGDINGAVAQRMDQLRKCVSDQKAREPDASGTLKMRWIIQGDGSVWDVKCLTPEYEKGQFAACIGGVVKGIRFPRSTTSGQEVTFPFNF